LRLKFGLALIFEAGWLSLRLRGLVAVKRMSFTYILQSFITLFERENSRSTDHNST